jgi:hypothetical protein
VPVAVPDEAPGAVAVAVIVLALTVRAEPMLVSPKLLPLSVPAKMPGLVAAARSENNVLISPKF